MFLSQPFLPFILWCCSLLQGNLVWINHPTILENKQVTILAGSKIYLKGTTNVSNFKCDCEEYFEPINVEMEAKPPCFTYRKANLKMRTEKLNCHNEKMNRDMYRALHAAAYPNIKVELLENAVDLKKSATLNTWFDVNAKIRLTITNVTQETYLQVKAKRTSVKAFELQGSKCILLTDFGITPPEAMFGMIKVDNTVSLHFDLKMMTE